MGKIYRLTDGTLNYYGSTNQSLAQRLAEHKYAFKNGRKSYTSEMIFKTGNKITIECIEEQDDLETLLEREKWYIRNNPCVNRIGLEVPIKNEKRRNRYLVKKLLLAELQNYNLC